MKIKKILLIVPFFLEFGLSSCSSTKEHVFFGENIYIQNANFFDLVTEQINIKFNIDFMSDNFYMKNFYYQIDKAAINLKSENSIIQTLENCESILFNVGNYELLRLMNYSQNEINYDSEVLRTSKEMFEYYLTQTLDIFKEYTNEIRLMSLYDSLILESDIDNQYKEIIREYNDIIKMVAEDNGINYISIEKASRFIVSNNKLSLSGANYIIEKIRDSYGIG